jgi:cobalt/nickel transport system permease protein
MNTQLDTLAYSNRLRHLPPWQKLSFAIAILLIALGSHPPVQLAIALWLMVWMVGYAGIPVRIYGQLMTGVVLFLLTSLPVLILNATPVDSFHRLELNPLFDLRLFHWQLYFSRQGLAQAVTVFCRAIASTSCLFFIVFTIPFVELALILTRLGCPVILTELMLLSYRFIFLLAEVAQRIVTAQTARGGYRTRKLTLNSVGLLIRQLLQRTIERYYQLSLGVKARGFNHEFRFYYPQSYAYSPRYGFEAIAGCTGLLSWEILYRIYG